MRKLNDLELSIKSKQELKIMRNEIYARYGYAFIDGGEMDKYFRHQDWYKPYYTNVDSFLTQIEIYNIVKIKEFENK